MVVWTPKERAMAKAGYAYSAGSVRNKLRRMVRTLDGYRRGEVVFDVAAYNAHLDK